MRNLRTFLMLALGGAATLLLGGATALRSAATAATPGERILYAFAEHGTGDGAGPLTGVVADRAGTLFGTTTFGGAYGGGAVFELRPARDGTYRERIIHSFGAPGDGATPAGGIAVAASGALYTVTIQGGATNAGTVVELRRAGETYRERVVFDFGPGSVGNQPLGTPVIDGAGNVFGVTQFGGSFNGICGHVGGCGVVFELSPQGKGFAERTIYALPGGTGGILPQAGLASDNAGNLYGTAYAGGDPSCDGGGGCGVVFKLQPKGKAYSATTIYAFHGGSDGATPFSALTVDEASGTLYGTTEYGGGNCCGTVYRLAPGGSGYGESVLHSFHGGLGGLLPQAPVLLARGGVIYGTADIGGKGCGGVGCGFVFKMTPQGSQYAFSVVHYFASGKDGAEPQWSPLLPDSSGALYGTTRSGGGRKCGDGGPGGTLGCGVVFRLEP